MIDHRDNAVGAHATWETKYIQLSGTVVETGFVDKQVTNLVITGNQFYAGGQSSEETIRYPYVLLQPETVDATVKCVLQPGWSGDLKGVHHGGWMRISAHFVSIQDGTPPQVLLRECRVREYQNTGVTRVPAPPRAPASTPDPASSTL